MVFDLWCPPCPGEGVPVLPLLLFCQLLDHTEAPWDKLAGQRLPICLDQTFKQQESIVRPPLNDALHSVFNTLINVYLLQQHTEGACEDLLGGLEPTADQA